MLTCSAGVLRDNFLTRARVSQARVKRLWTAPSRFSQNVAFVKVYRLAYNSGVVYRT